MHDLLCKAWTDRGLVHSAKGRIFNNCTISKLDERPSIFTTDQPIFSSKTILYKDYYRKGSVEKISGRESQGAWRQDEIIGGNPPIVK
jgi:hypothetical protein